jgi:protein SCO1/2
MDGARRRRGLNGMTPRITCGHRGGRALGRAAARFADLRRLLCIVAVLSAAPALADHGSVQKHNRAAAGWPLPTFALVDHRGGPFTDRNLQGRWSFLLFGDLRCGEPCNAALAALRGMTERIARTQAVKQVQVVFISLDPERDEPSALRRYLSEFGAHFIVVTGPRATLQQLVEETGVGAGIRETGGIEPAGALSAAPRYSGSLLLIGPDGVIRIEFLPPFDVKRLTAEFLKIRARG